MDTLTVPEFARATTAFDDAVDATRGIDRICSSSDWVVPSYLSWGRDAEPLILRSDAGWATLCARRDVDGVRYLCPPEAAWGFGSPVATDDATTFGRRLVRALEKVPGWRVVLLTGLVPDSPLENELRRAIGERHRLRNGPVMTRCRARLDEGATALLERKPAKWQRDLRRAHRRAEDHGFEVVTAEGDLAAGFERLMDIERRSWKGRSGSGLIEPELRRFYWKLSQRVGPLGRLRLLFARADDRDIGYILGHVRHTTYRGLQISYDNAYRSLSVGTLLQAFQIEQLAAEGVRIYDLGMEMAYKRRWADETLDTRTTVIIRR